MRVNMIIGHPEKNTAKRIICAIIQEGGGHLESQVRLYKAFYWAHLAYWGMYEGILSSYPIARMPNGPGVDRGEDLLFELHAEGLISIEEKPVHGAPNPERCFKLK